MAEIHGKDGAVMSGGSAVASIDSWTLSVDLEVADISSYGNNDRRFLAGLRNATGSVSGTYNSTNATQLAIQNQFSSTGTVASTTVVLLTNNTTGSKRGFKGTAYFTNVSVNSDISDKVGFSANVQFTGGVARYTT